MPVSRRTIVASVPLGFLQGRLAAQSPDRDWGIAPIGWPGERPGDGFWVRHGYACENPVFAPGWWHTGENWNAIAGNTGGAEVYALADGEVVYAGFDYPGRVVIVEHGPEIFAMYGHLDPDLRVVEGDAVAVGDVLATVLDQGTDESPEQSPSHLHFEVRTFLVKDEINGDRPQHGVHCGYQCPPGPGYWPMGAEHPSTMGWLNPTHERLRRWAESHPGGVLVRNSGEPEAQPVFGSPTSGSRQLGEIGEDRIEIVDWWIEAPDLTEYGAEATQVWAELESGGWVQVAVPDDGVVGNDGRWAALRLPWLIEG